MITRTRAELEECLRGKSRAQLVDLIFSLVTFEQLLTAREIAAASHMSKRDVLAAMKAGRFVDPMFGPGFFCRASNSLRVSASAANAWRESFFVRIPGNGSGLFPIPARKKERAVIPGPYTDLVGGNSLQKAARDRVTVRRLSPAFLGSK